MNPHVYWGQSLTGEPLGITGEVAEFEAARLLDVEFVAAGQAGYDANLQVVDFQLSSIIVPTVRVLEKGMYKRFVSPNSVVSVRRYSSS